jgi:fucose-1-phosphate guanylyltransferase
VGKIFAALPFGSPVYTMLEMKLAGYIDFPAKMSPGVFVTCADDIELCVTVTLTLDPEYNPHPNA